jgi:hypothetical protein
MPRYQDTTQPPLCVCRCIHLPTAYTAIHSSGAALRTLLYRQSKPPLCPSKNRSARAILATLLQHQQPTNQATNPRPYHLPLGDEEVTSLPRNEKLSLWVKKPTVTTCYISTKGRRELFERAQHLRKLKGREDSFFFYLDLPFQFLCKLCIQTAVYRALAK